MLLSLIALWVSIGQGFPRVVNFWAYVPGHISYQSQIRPSPLHITRKELSNGIWKFEKQTLGAEVKEFSSLPWKRPIKQRKWLSVEENHNQRIGGLIVIANQLSVEVNNKRTIAEWKVEIVDHRYHISAVGRSRYTFYRISKYRSLEHWYHIPHPANPAVHQLCHTPKYARGPICDILSHRRGRTGNS